MNPIIQFFRTVTGRRRRHRTLKEQIMSDIASIKASLTTAEGELSDAEAACTDLEGRIAAGGFASPADLSEIDSRVQGLGTRTLALTGRLDAIAPTGPAGATGPSGPAAAAAS